MKEPYLALLDHTVQWIFNKTQLSTDGAASSKKGRSENAAQYLQLVISASYDLVPKSRQEIIDICLRDLADVLPATMDAELTKATVIKEVHATFSPEPGIDEWRPAQRTSVQGLALAGDWTSTGWPSTMESAVRSGYLAAEALTEGFGAPQKFLQPDLPLEGLSAFWARKAARSRS
jgi:zeta-carotene desaturase